MKKQYKMIKLPKGRGTFRTIYAPSKPYKRKLASFLLDLQQKVHNADHDEIVHGFMRGRGPVSNALKHVGYAYTLSLDLKDFFDSVTSEMVEEYLSEEERELCFIDGIARQGLPTSPLIANMALLKLDRQIKDAIAEEGVFTVYTRYADDLIFSFNHEAFAPTLETLVEKIMTEGGFQLNRKKRRLQSAKNGRRMITGIAVDEHGIHPSRKLKRRIRAAVHQKNRESAFGLLSWAECKEPKAFYTDRDLLNKNIFREEALDLSNDFYLSDLLSFEAYVDAVEEDFGNSDLAHEHDREKWESQKSAFLAQREAFYQKEKQLADAARKVAREDMEKHFIEEEEADQKEEMPLRQRETVPKPPPRPATAFEKKEEKQKELNIDFDTLKEIEQEEVANFQNEKKAHRRKREAIASANEENEAKRRSLNKVFMASLLPIVLFLGAMSYYFSATEIKKKAAYPLFVNVTPFDAKVQIMNISEAYATGIELKPGEYDIRISKQGYNPQRFWITMGQEPLVVTRELTKVKKRKVY